MLGGWGRGASPTRVPVLGGRMEVGVSLGWDGGVSPTWVVILGGPSRGWVGSGGGTGGVPSCVAVLGEHEQVRDGQPALLLRG